MLCKNCGSKDFTIGETYGAHFCSSCGVVDDSNNFDHQFGGISGPEGTFIRVGTAGAGTNYSYKEHKLYQSDTIINEITFRLELTSICATEVKEMVEKITESEFGLGEWFSVLVGACSCIVMRSTNRQLPISEVANAVGCDLYEMGTMISRVKQFLTLELPEFDIIGMLERMIRSFSGFKAVDVDKLETMVQQGNFIIQCTIKWFLTTGRRPVQVAVAVLVFIANLNGIFVRIEDAANEAFLSVRTCKKRYNELLKAFVKVAQKLPWGKDVNVKNIIKNTPFVLMYMDMKSKENVGMKKKMLENEDMISSQFDIKELVGECLDSRLEYGAAKNESEQRILSLSELESLKISHETLGKMYSKLTSMMKWKEKREQSEITERQNWCSDTNLFICNEWWNSRSELCNKVMGEELAEKDVGLDMLPPSYIRGCQKVQMRREKIKAAKTRISSIACSVNNKALVVVGDDNGRRKRRKMKGQELDWEDFIIEALLLHQVKEEEIEKGHYNTLLDLHVFNSGVV